MTRLIALWLVFSATVAAAQIKTGEISGVVRDSVGGVLPGAIVVATHTASGQKVERVTDGEGRYFLPALRLGVWMVEARLDGRNFLALAQLSDAVVIPPGGTRGEALQQAGPLPNVGGQRSGHNIYLLDGTKVTDELFNNLVINPSVDSIEEFKIQRPAASISSHFFRTRQVSRVRCSEIGGLMRSSSSSQGHRSQ